MSAIRHLSRHLRRSSLVLMTLLFASRTWADLPLHERLQQLKSGLHTTLPGTTISLASAEQDEVISAEVSSTLPHPFEQVSAALSRPENWCRFMPLHFNIKACTHQPLPQGHLVNIYSGRKHYQAPDDSYHMAYRFEVAQQDEQQLVLQLSAPRGPASTRDYRIEITALRTAQHTLLHIRTSYVPSVFSSMLTGSYLATLGRDKIGFSRVAKDGEEHPVKGVRGVIERNVMRYHLAIDAFLATSNPSGTSAHEAMLGYWFDHNDSYPQQLHEMPRQEYLAIKRREHLNQLQLQRAIDKRARLVAMQADKSGG